MSEQNPAVFLQAGSHPARGVRRMFQTTHLQDGILGRDDLQVTQNGTPNMSVNVAGGTALIAGTEDTYQGYYYVDNQGTTNLSIAAADPTNPRIDLVVAKVEDSEYSGATDAWSLAVVTGTPAGSPSVPSAPANSISLAQVAVAALASSIVDANITDLRISTQKGRAAARGGSIITTSADRPSVTEGVEIYETDTNKGYVYDGSAWVQVSELGAPTSWSAVITQSATVAGTVTYGAYRKMGRLVTANLLWSTTNPGASAALYVSYPGSATPANTANMVIGSGYIYDGSVNRVAIAVATASGIAFLRDASASFWSTALASGHGLSLQLTYFAAA